MRAKRPAFLSRRENSLRRSWTSTAGALRRCSSIDSSTSRETPSTHTRNTRTTARDARTTAGRGNGCPRCGRGISSSRDDTSAGRWRPYLPSCYGSDRFRRRRWTEGDGASELLQAAWALFLWSNAERRRDVGAGDQALPGERGARPLPDAREALEWAAETRVSMVDLKFCDLLGTWQHMTLPLRGVRRRRVRGGPRLRRLLDPRLAGDLGVGHAADARSDLGDPRPGHRGADALARSARSPTRSRARATRATRARSRSGPRSTCARPGSPTRASSAPSASSSSSTRSATTSARTRRTTRSTRPRASGTPASPASATRRARRRATSRRRRTTRSTTCARRWC